MANHNVKINFLFNSAYQISGIIIPVITLPYLTRTLHAKGMGEYSFALSVAYYFYLFIRLGLQNYGNRAIACIKEDKNTLSKTFWEIYAFQCFWGMLMSIVYLFYCWAYAPDKVLAYIFLLVVLTGGIDVTWALHGLEEFKVTSVRDMTVKVLSAVLIFLFVNKPCDVWKYSVIYGSSFFLSQLLSFPVILKRIDWVLPEYKGILTHVKPNIVLFLPTIAVSIYKTMDKIMIGYMAGDIELGLYHSCENVIAVPLALITALGTVMLPRMSNMVSNKDDEKTIERVFNNSIVFAMLISTPMCFGIMTVAHEFVPIFFGDGFEKCIAILDIILPSCIFLAFANVVRTQYLLPRKRDNLYICSLFWGAGVNILLNLMLIPYLASVGAAIGTLAAEITVCVIQSISVYKEANIGKNIINSMPFILAGGLMLLVFRGYVVSQVDNQILALLIKVFICGIFYLIMIVNILATKKMLKSIWKRKMRRKTGT